MSAPRSSAFLFVSANWARYAVGGMVSTHNAALNKATQTVEHVTMNKKMTTLLFTTVMATTAAGCSRTVTYADVEPLFREKCAGCHTDDKEGVVKSGFSVASYETIMKGTRLGPVVIAGSSESSTLYRMVAGETDPKIHMPHGGDALGDEQIATIRTWIDQGAVK
jgi:hypothetical protein